MTVRWTEADVNRYLHEGQPPPVTEKAFMQAVVRIAKDASDMHFHVHDSRRSPHGWPDLALIRPTGGTLYLVETKTDAGQVTPAQAAWLDALAGCTGVVAEVWKPKDMKEICRKLRQ